MLRYKTPPYSGDISSITLDTLTCQKQNRNACVLSIRARRWLTDYRTTVPEITENVYHTEHNPSGIISLALSENVTSRFGPDNLYEHDLISRQHLSHEPVTKFINKHFEIDRSIATTYAGSTVGGARFRASMERHINRFFAPVITPITPDNVVCAKGVTATCSILAYSLADQDDGRLLMRPIYGKMENDWTLMAEMKTLYVNMEEVDPFSENIVQKYVTRIEQAIKVDIIPKVLLLVNPHNPSGHCYPRSTPLEIMKLCALHNIHLFSDEIYALTVFDTDDPSAIPFTSVLSIDSNSLISPDLVYVVYGLSKDFGAPGLHISSIITRNSDFLKAFRAIGLLHAPSRASCAIGCAILDDTKMVTSMLNEAGIKYWKGGNAGFFLWNPNTLLSERLLAGGVYLNPNAEWSEYPGWFRLVYSFDPIKIEEGVRKEVSSFYKCAIMLR